jgi:HSP20 family molecular chaperone IbpA
VNVFETEGEVVLLADMPGVAKESLNISVEGRELCIEGKRERQWPENVEPFYSEISTERLSRKFVVGRDVDVEKIEAEMKHGVLRLRLPKFESAKPRKIAVVVT